MMTYLATLGFNELLILVLGIFVVVFVLKKLFKLAITIAIIAGVIYFGLPLLQTAMSRM